MNYLEWIIALRYLFARDRSVLISVNTLISVAGVAVGVAVLVVVMGVMDGATQLLFGQITDLFPHVSITRLDDQGGVLPIDPKIADDLRKDPRVAFAEQTLARGTLIQAQEGAGEQKEMIQLMCPPMLGTGTLYEFRNGLGNQPFAVPEGKILLGKPMAERLGVTSGSQVIVIPFNPAAKANAARSALRHVRLTVMTTYETGYYEFDFNKAFIAPAQFHLMFPGTEKGGDYIHVRLKDPNQAASFVRSLHLPEGLVIRTWEQSDKEFFAALQFQKFTLVIILMLIVVVAAFNIIGTLVLMVYEKTREIGILKATGMRRGMIARIFLLDGVLIGFAGTGAGVVLGLLFSEGLRLYKFQMPAAVYNFSTLPVKNEPVAIAIVIIGSMAICTLASLLPALRAARLNPVEALRYE